MEKKFYHNKKRITLKNSKIVKNKSIGSKFYIAKRNYKPIFIS